MRFTYKDKEYNFVGYNEDDFLQDLIDIGEDDLINLDSVLPSSIFDSFILDQYVKYINYEDFVMNKEVAKGFDFMGVINHNNYPIDYWKCKLQDNRVRENFNKDKLHSDPLFGLKDVSHLLPPNTLKQLDVIAKTLADGCYLAGGALSNVLAINKRYKDLFCHSELEEAYMILKRQHRVKDMDIFMTKDIAVISELDRIIDLLSKSRKMKVSHRKTDFAISTHVYTISVISYITQFILRKYRSPNEIVYGFDIDASGLILIDGRVYATHCAEYSILNKEIYFDPERSSPSYTKRLIKYGEKGYNVKVPQIDWNKVDYNNLNKIRVNLSILSKHSFALSSVLKIKSFAILLIYLYYKDDYSNFIYSPSASYDIRGTPYEFEELRETDLYINRVNSFMIIRGEHANRKENLSDCIELMTDEYKELMKYDVKDTDPMSQITGSFVPEITSFEDYSYVPWLYGKGNRVVRKITYKNTDGDVLDSISFAKMGTSYNFDFIVSKLQFYRFRTSNWVTDKYDNIYYNGQYYRRRIYSKYFKKCESYEIGEESVYIV